MRFAAGEGNPAEYGLELHFGVVKKMRGALDYDIITEVVLDDKLEDRVKEVIEIYLNRPRVAIANLKKLLTSHIQNRIANI